MDDPKGALEMIVYGMFLQSNEWNFIEHAVQTGLAEGFPQIAFSPDKVLCIQELPEQKDKYGEDFCLFTLVTGDCIVARVRFKTAAGEAFVGVYHGEI